MTTRPLHEPSFLILTALAAAPQHGWGIIGDVERISDGRVHLRAGTLYAALDRLLDEGLIAVDGEEVVDARLRRYYKLTDTGARRLSSEVERLQRHTAVAAKRLRRSGATAVRPKGVEA